MQCQLASVVQEQGSQVHSLATWESSEIKCESGIAVDCQINPGHGTNTEIYNYTQAREVGPGKVTGCLVMCGQTPTFVFVEGSWPSGPNGVGGDVNHIPGTPTQFQGHPGMHMQPPPSGNPSPAGSPYPQNIHWQYQCPRCDNRFATIQELRSHEPGTGVTCHSVMVSHQSTAHTPPTGRGSHTTRGRGSRGGGRAPRKKKATNNSAAGSRRPSGANASESKEEPQGRFQCSICEKVFSEEQYYDVHMRMNTFKPFPCKICKSHFGSESSLSNHTKHFHKEKHKCPFCTRQYTWKIRLYNHLKEHMDEQITVGVFGT